MLFPICAEHGVLYGKYEEEEKEDQEQACRRPCMAVASALETVDCRLYRVDGRELGGRSDGFRRRYG